MANPPIAPDLVDRVVALAVSGVRPTDICSQLDGKVKLAKIYHLISEARAEGKLIPKFGTGPTPGRRRSEGSRGHLTVLVAGAAELKLRDAAKAREITVGKLARRLLETIARDNLFIAVLDDGDAR
jgi:hypothetical protein